ncbi:MAG: hypothetical protein QOJ99_2520 [Bryobacterales bacterium]|nr:hypothetical protein [Bryobacterales bacterium]
MPGVAGSGEGGLDPSWTTLPGYDKGKSSGFGLNAKTLGIAGAAIGGGIAAFDQFRHADVRGAIGGTGALAGATGSILALSGVSGPAVPILAGVGLALGLVTSLIGDPKKIRENEITLALERNRRHVPTALNVSQDSMATIPTSTPREIFDSRRSGRSRRYQTPTPGTRAAKRTRFLAGRFPVPDDAGAGRGSLPSERDRYPGRRGVHPEIRRCDR